MAQKEPAKHREDPVQKELAAVKRLLVLLLIKTGATQEEIALALQLDRAEVSRLVSSRKIKRYGFAQEAR